jgi:Lrp/AsnC family transcriptional regulator, leucine-responsive regulatory protein
VGSSSTNSDSPSTTAPSLDAFDLRILRLLALDARMSIRSVSREVGMSAPSVTERISRLERDGVIRGYRAEIEPAALGVPLVVYVGAVAVQGVDQRRVAHALRELLEVEDVQIVTGGQDMLIRLRVRSTEHLRECLFDRIWNIEGLGRTQTYISLDQMERKLFDVELVDSLLASASEAEKTTGTKNRSRRSRQPPEG